MHWLLIIYLMNKCEMSDKAYPVSADISTDRAGKRFGRGQSGIELWVEVAQYVMLQLSSVIAILSTVVAVKVILSTSLSFQALCRLLNRPLRRFPGKPLGSPAGRPA